MGVLTVYTCVLASLLLEDAQMEEVGSQLGGCLIATSAQGGLVGWWESEPTTTKRFNIENSRQYIIPFRSIFLSEDGRKMGRWRCPARVTAVLLCTGWRAEDRGDGGVEEDQLLLAGDVQVATFFICNCTYILCRVVCGNMKDFNY